MRLRSARLLCERSLSITALDFELLEGIAKHPKAFAQEISQVAREEVGQRCLDRDYYDRTCN